MQDHNITPNFIYAKIMGQNYQKFTPALYTTTKYHKV